MKENKPTINKFLEHFNSKSSMTLTNYQMCFAKSLLDYRVVHFSGGRGSGRTMVINAMNDYFADKHACDDNITVEATK